MACFLLAAGCGAVMRARPEVPRAATQEEAGSVHFAVLSVGRWDEFVDALQPEFDLTPEGALERVLAPTRISARHDEDRVALRIAAGADAEAPAPEGKDRHEAVLPDVTLHADPMTQYWAATALYQEVQLLSRYLRHAAIRPGTVPYVVRMQLTLLPRRRRLPYDAYATLSFFPAGKHDGPGWSVRGDGEPQPETAEAPAPVPEVLPLLVTDNLEAGIAAASARSARELGLAAGGKGGSVGLAAGSSETERAAGIDLNSLLTVARVTDNTLRVRLGALQQGSSQYAMVPRTHGITVLVMMPEGAKRLYVAVRTTMVDVDTGEQLPQRSEARVLELLQSLGAEYDVPAETLRELLRLAQRNEAGAFFATAGDLARARELWLDLVSIAAGGQRSAAVVDLEPPARPAAMALLPPDQGLLVDDDGARCVVTVVGGAHLERRNLRALLVVPREGDRPLALAPLEPPALVAGGATLRLVFASLQGRAGLSTAGLAVRLEYGDAEPATYRDVQYAYRKR